MYEQQHDYSWIEKKLISRFKIALEFIYNFH